MFTLVWGLYTSVFGEETKKVLIIGLESSGKTTLLEQLRWMYRANGSSSPQSHFSNKVSTGIKTEYSGRFTPAPAEVICNKKIKPTKGLNVSHVTHVPSPPEVGMSGSGLALHQDGPVKCGSSYAPRVHTPTPLTLWDVGGSMQTLWGNYFGLCHGVIFVVDSTLVAVASGGNDEEGEISSGDASLSSLPVDAAATGANQGPGCCEGSDTTENKYEQQRLRSIRRAYEKNAAILQEVFFHPLLEAAPLLIVSNKVDVPGHCSLREMQDALRLVDMALMDEIYATEGGSAVRDCETLSKKDDEAEPETLGSGVSDFAPCETYFGGAASAPAGTSGIGSRVMRLVEMSALCGTGVYEGVDWLVSQMHASNREPIADGSG
uniref:Uncharacterized protein TCIL3000_9_540 n=1 Tax=Trypanosoma congolense (strain IL3000) TaxID=1068625 RepID=G0UTE6_TRYCI|nr:unnamed protein product [Trypanosoma congolense IL3000]